MKLLVLYQRRWWLFYLPLIFCTVLALWFAVKHWLVLPPTQVVIAAGSPQGGYAKLAQRYAVALENKGINVEIVYADNENGALTRLRDPNDAASVGFGHGVYAQAADCLQALAVIDSEPVWIFSNRNGPNAVALAKGTRVAAGAANSPVNIATKQILAHAGVLQKDVKFESKTGLAAAEALLDGSIDIFFAMAGDDAPAIEFLTRKGGIQLLGIERAGVLASRDTALQLLLLPEGSLELGSNIPPQDLTMASLQTHLLVEKKVHPALQRALLDAAVDIHEEPTFLQRHGQFPTYASSDFPLSPTAKAYSLNSRPWLETLLPYGKAQLAELVLYALIPILTLAFVVLAWIPKLFDWRVSAALNYFYGDLKFLETEMDSVATTNPIELRALLERLDAIEQRVVEMDLPNEYSQRWYTLREHLSAAQERLLKLRAR